MNSPFHCKTQWQMFLLLSGGHVGAHPDGHRPTWRLHRKHSIILGKQFLKTFRVWKIILTWILVRVFLYQPHFISQILEFIVLFLCLLAWQWKPAIKLNGWVEWSWSNIIHVILKSDECAARIRFDIVSMISDQNCTTRSSITTLF